MTLLYGAYRVPGKRPQITWEMLRSEIIETRRACRGYVDTRLDLAAAGRCIKIRLAGAAREHISRAANRLIGARGMALERGLLLQISCMLNERVLNERGISGEHMSHEYRLVDQIEEN